MILHKPLVQIHGIRLDIVNECQERAITVYQVFYNCYSAILRQTMQQVNEMIQNGSFGQNRKRDVLEAQSTINDAIESLALLDITYPHEYNQPSLSWFSRWLVIVAHFSVIRPLFYAYISPSSLLFPWAVCLISISFCSMMFFPCCCVLRFYALCFGASTVPNLHAFLGFYFCSSALIFHLLFACLLLIAMSTWG